MYTSEFLSFFYLYFIFLYIYISVSHFQTMFEIVQMERSHDDNFKMHNARTDANFRALTARPRTYALARARDRN